MEYIKTSCKIDPDTETHREITTAELGSIGYESFTETDDLLEAYIVSADFSLEALQNLFHEEFHPFKVAFSSEIIADQNWNEVWEKNYFQPLLIADRCLIRAPFHSIYPASEYEIVIEPGMAFGTGNHETTTLMVTEILNQHLTGKIVLDMGCGTGILGILASLRGAQTITAIDIDNWAFKSTIENAGFNKISNIEILQGGVEVIPDQKFDFIYANIQRNILLNDLPFYAKALKKGGELIMSGFYFKDLASIKEGAAKSGLEFLRFSENETWVSVVFTLI